MELMRECKRWKNAINNAKSKRNLIKKLLLNPDLGLDDQLEFNLMVRHLDAKISALKAGRDQFFAEHQIEKPIYPHRVEQALAFEAKQHEPHED